MKIVYKNEVIFKLIYLMLILSAVVFISIYSSDRTVIFISIFSPIIYIPLAFRKEIRRFRLAKKEFPLEFRNIISEYSKFYKFLDDNGKRKFEKDISIFLKEHSIRGIRGEETDLRTKVLVAAGVATILHGREEWEPPFSDGVVVYPGETFDPEYNLHKGQIAGMAGDRRPLLVTKKILERSFKDPDDGYNSLIHEIAHYFDFENPHLSGVPVIGSERGRTEEWLKTMEKERKRVNSGKSFLRPYAGSNEAEFFAVATEFFFEKPDEMLTENPKLYDMLRGFYNIDTQLLFKDRN